MTEFQFTLVLLNLFAIPLGLITLSYGITGIIVDQIKNNNINQKYINNLIIGIIIGLILGQFIIK